jgi:hypothetical protein
MEQLLQYKHVRLSVTHDLMPGESASRFPSQANNLCFEILIKGNKMLIDYKHHDCVSKNLNATFLIKDMKKIRIL